MNKPFKVEFGSIYHESGIMYDQIGVIVDKQGGMMKYGHMDGPNNLADYFSSYVKKYRDVGFNDIADNLILVGFDSYKGVLSVEEICTFMNYMLLCSANGSRIVNMLKMDADELHVKIKELQEVGY